MKRMNLRPRRVLHILMALCAAGALCCAGILISDSREYARGDAAYQEMRSLREPRETEGEPAAAPPQAAAETAGAAEADGVDFSALAGLSPDVVAWLASESGEIDYPVVQGADNEYYLRHLVTGERNKLGAIFMDYRNQADFSDKNTVIYGHNMKDGSMFSSLTEYKAQDYYDRFPTMTLSTPDGDLQLELFAGMVVDGSRESVRFAFDGDADFQSYIAALKAASSFRSDTAVSADERIVTLCTCSYEFQQARYALFGKLTPAQGKGA